MKHKTYKIHKYMGKRHTDFTDTRENADLEYTRSQSQR